MQSTETKNSDSHTTKKLNELLQGEMSAVETYKQALKTVENCSCESELTASLACHQNRADELSMKVSGLGDTPAASSGMWGAFANTMEGGAVLLGAKAAIGMLEEGEDHGNKQYQELMNDSDPIVKQVAADLYPKQQGTHKSAKDLKVRMA